MFFRIVRAPGGKGVQHEYVRLVESYREHGKPKQRVVCNLGRKDLLVANLDSLNRLLGAGEPADTERAAEQVAGADAWDWGPMLVTATLWRELGLEQILDRLGGRGKRDGVALKRASFGAGRQPAMCSVKRARSGALARDRLRLRPAGAAVGAAVAR